MNDAQLLRYSRQILLPAVDEAGQQKFLESRVLIIGVGGLGSPVAMYLAAAGVGHLTLVDDDHVDLSNLQRQIVHRTDEIGALKVDSAARQLQAINPDIRVDRVSHRLDDQSMLAAVSVADVVVDACDNLQTRLQINAACVASATPLVSGAAIRLEGQVSVFLNDRPGCLACLYPDSDAEPEGCAESGVLGPVVGLIGSVQALETLKLLAGFGECLSGRLLMLDAWSMQWHELGLSPRIECPVCAAHQP